MCKEIFSLMNKVTENPKSNVDRFLLFCSMVMKTSANGLYIEEKLDCLISRILKMPMLNRFKLKSKFEKFIKVNDFSPNKLKDFLQSIKNNEGLPSPDENYEVDILCFFAQMRAEQIFTDVESYKEILKEVCVEASNTKAINEQKQKIFADYVVELAKILDDKFELDKNSTKSNDSDISKASSEPNFKSLQQIKENNNLLQDSNFDLEHILNQKFKLADTNNLTPDEQFLNFVLNSDLTQESITSDPYNVVLALKIPENLAPETVLKIYVHVFDRFRLFADIKPLYWKIQKCCDKLLSSFLSEFDSLDKLLEADKKLDEHYKRLYYESLKNILMSYLEKNKMDLVVFLIYSERLHDQGYASVIYKSLSKYNFDDILQFFCDNDEFVEPIFNYVNDHIYRFEIAPGFEDDFGYKYEKHKIMVARARLLISSLRAQEKGSVKRKKLNYLISCLMLQFESYSNTFQTDIDMFIDLFELENSFFKYRKLFAGVESEQDVTNELKQKLNRWVEEFCNQVKFSPELPPRQLEIFTKISKCSVTSKDFICDLYDLSVESQVLNQKQIPNVHELKNWDADYDSVLKAYETELDSRLKNFQLLFESTHFLESNKKKIIENLLHEKKMLEIYYKQQIENIQTDELFANNGLAEEDLTKEYCKDYIEKELSPKYEQHQLRQRMSFLDWFNGLSHQSKLLGLLLLLVTLTGIGFIAFYLVHEFIWKPWAKRKCQEIDKYFAVEKVKYIIEDRKKANEENFIVCRDKLDEFIELHQKTTVPNLIDTNENNMKQSNPDVSNKNKIIIEQLKVNSGNPNNFESNQINITNQKPNHEKEITATEKENKGDTSKNKTEQSDSNIPNQSSNNIPGQTK